MYEGHSALAALLLGVYVRAELRMVLLHVYIVLFITCCGSYIFLLITEVV
jgi:hypothetical protein